jgi:polyisoprenyl-phosphate glycosyltransferase
MYSLVIPVYRNEGSIPALLETLNGLSLALDAPLEVVFVVDGSPDSSFELLRNKLPQARFSSRLIAHARNFGSFAAIRTGLRAATGKFFAAMAADLQEPITLIETFFRVLKAGEADVVIGERASRADGSMAATLFWRLYRLAINPAIPSGGVDVFGCNSLALDALLKLQESNSSLVAQLFWIGFRRQNVRYDRVARAAGKSAWTFRKKVRYLLDSVYSFTDLPIRLLTAGGAIAMTSAVALGVVVLWARATGRIEVAGYTPIILTIVFFGGLNALGLGIIGEYVWRAFENTKARPASLVVSEMTFEGSGVVQDGTPVRVRDRT